MEEKEYIKDEQIMMSFDTFTMRDLVPDDHLVIKLDRYVDWSFIYELCDPLYSDMGAQRIDPVVLFKIVFINILFDIHSIRETCRQIEVNNAYRWFLGLGLFDKVPDHSTISANYRRKFRDNDICSAIFLCVIEQLLENGVIDPSTVFVDGTHIKANANKHRSHREVADEVAMAFQEELDRDIDADRERNGLKPLKREEEKEETGSQVKESEGEEEPTLFTVDSPDGNDTSEEKEETSDKADPEESEESAPAEEKEKAADTTDSSEEGEKESEPEKQRFRTVSNTDSDSGFFHKGTHEQCFAYNANVACDKNGYVLGMSLDPGNVHDSRAFFHLKAKLDEIYGSGIEIYVADAGYSTAPICHMVHEGGQEIIVPYKRVAAKREGFYKKYQYRYDSENDCFTCPNGLVLRYCTTNREGKRVYRSDPDECESCPARDRCTESRNCTKVIERHIWEEDRETSIRLQKSEEGREIYSLRKETIERVFAEGKRRHGLGYTLYRGKKRVEDYTLLTFAMMNLKKMCLHLARQEQYALN